VLALPAVTVTGVIGGGVLTAVAITCLAVADAPMAVAACTAFGMLGAAGAWARFQEMRSRRALLPPERLPRRLPASAPWTTGELAALKGSAGLEEQLAATPQRWRERRYR